MLRFAVAFSSQEGQTERIAHHVAREIENRGAVARLVNVQDPEDCAQVGDYDAAIIAGPVHMGAHGAPLTAFIAKHAERLNQVHSAFLSVSLAAASDDPAERKGAEAAAETLCQETDWRPDTTLLVAGAVHDRQTGFFKRLVLHAILRRKGVALNPSGDTEFTDWETLDAFVRDFVAGTPRPPVEDAPAP